jgi:hypothetical protein
MVDLLERDPVTAEPERALRGDVTGNRDAAEVEAPVSLRPALAAGLANGAAALVVGGVFNSWPARLFSLAVTTGATGLAVWTVRSRRPTMAQLVAPLALLWFALFSVLPGGSPGDIRRLVQDAVDAARLLQIPIPFDPGWRPLLVVIFGLLAYGSARIGTAMGRPMLGVMLPVPLIALAAMSQPTSAQITAGVFATLPLLAAFGVLFGVGEGQGIRELGRSFELTRVIRGGAGMVALGVALVVLGHTSFLFPKPAFDPNDRPQKPKSIPLSEQRDRVLFTVKAPAGFTGPWRTNVLDVYEDDTWKLPGSNPSRLVDLPKDGRLDKDSTQPAAIDVTITTGDLGPTAVMPVVPTAQTVTFPRGHPDLRLDTRTGTLKVPAGRAPSGLVYTLKLASYPAAAALATIDKVTADESMLEIAAAPPAIQKLLAESPPGPGARLDHLRHQLLDHVTATGAGSPKQMTPARVVDRLQGSKTGTPFEIVAAQAMLARWSGVPARIGVGFSGTNDENGLFTVRPKDAEQWLEVRFDGYGWLPLLDIPPQAQADLENKDKNDERIMPSDEVAAQVYVPVELANPRLLFEQVRAVLYNVAPFAAALLAAVLLAPMLAKTVRRQRRERWADPIGPRARVAVAYAEFRDVATDLSLGDPFATAIEFLDHIQEDGEHRELAWVFTRSLYGDLAYEATEEDAKLAEEMSSSLVRRMRGAQPLQVRAVGALSRASLQRPFSTEMPNVNIPRPMRALRLAFWRAVRWPRRLVPRRWARRRTAEEVA